MQNRIRELRLVPAGELLPNPKNWRKHPPEQREALTAVLAKVGYADALLARETPDGLMLIDGHLRAEVTPDAEVPVLILDVSEAEADMILLTLDPLAAMAEADATQLESLRTSVPIDDAALEAMLDDLSNEPEVALPPEDDIPIDEPAPIDQRWCVMVECSDEDDQREFYERLQQEGRSCRLLTL